jgi:transposase
MVGRVLASAPPHHFELILGGLAALQDELSWWILPYVRTDIFNLVLADFAKHFGVGEDKQIVLAMDQAGWHTSKELEVPEGIHIILMPSHSPELQPAERLWPVTNEAIANESFKSLDELEEVLFERCKVLSRNCDLIRGLTFYHWWPQTDSSFTVCN